MKNLKGIPKLPFKRKNVKAFLFFLFFSICIWLVVQFSKSYQKTIDVPLVYENVPKDKLVKEHQQLLKASVKSTGFGFAGINFFKPKVKVDLASLPIANGRLLYVVTKHENELAEALNLPAGNFTFLSDTLKIPFVQKATKKLKVYPNISIAYAPGYASGYPVTIHPDSVQISGSKKQLDTLQGVFTEKLSLTKVSEDQRGSLALAIDEYKGVSFYEDEVTYSIKVEKYTEGKVEVPIEVLHTPAGKEVNIFPKKMMVVFNVSLENFDKISQNDFRVICDFSDITSDQNFMIPQLDVSPSYVSNARLSTNKVQFVIKK